MPIIKSAKKRVKIAAKASARNSLTRRQMREATKTFYKALEAGKPAEIAKAEKVAVSAIDQAAKKNVIHKNKAARKKSQLATAAKAKGVKSAKSVPKKPAAKKPVAKKASAKKTASKSPSKKKTAK